ncbi:MAG TPA: phage tail tape measure protein, partial [Hyphomicrobiaceae bacterium]|nr:phage tail tape measure protein [Hyphomicrobiaceae bacterium]
MAATIADLLVKVGADVSGAQRGLGEVEKSISGFGTKLSGAATQAGAGLMTLGAPLVALGGVAAKFAGDFEAKMNILGVSAKGAGANLDDLRTVAIKAGGDVTLVGVNASDAADLMTQFVKAGMSTGDMLGDMNGYMAGTAELGGAMRAALDMAAASELDFSQAGELANVVMSQFGIEADGVNGALDNLVRAADASQADVSDLAAAFANAGVQMASMKYGVAEVNTVLAMLSSEGLKGAEAGTNLSSMFNNMIGGSKKTVAMMEKLGVALFDSQGNARDMRDVIVDLERGFASLTEAEKAEAAQALAGRYGKTALLALVKQGVAGYDEMTQSMADAASMQEQAAARTEGFNAAMENLMGVVETFLIEAGTPLINDVLVPLIGMLSTLIGKLSGVNPAFLKWAVIIGGVAFGLGGLLLTVGKVVGAFIQIGSAVKLVAGLFGSLIPMIASAGAALWAALLPILPIIAAVAAAIGLLYLAWKTNFLGIRDLLEPLVSAFKITWQSIKATVQDFFGFLRGDMSWQ